MTAARNRKSRGAYRPTLLRAARVIPFTLLFLTALMLCQTGAAQSDRVHHGDLIDVDVAGGFEFDWRGRINPEGYIDELKGITEPIFALCRSESDVAADISKAYSAILRNPESTVKIISKEQRPLALIDGAVANPQRLQLNRWPTLREAIVIAGGVAGDASGEILLFRPANASCAPVPREANESVTLNIKIKDVLEGQPAANPEIRHGDIITVLRAPVIYVLGGVVNPGQISVRETASLSKVIAASGGLAKGADKSRVSVVRRENGVLSTTEYDLGKIAKEETPDPQLRSGDIVEVIDKNSERRRYELPEPEATRRPLPLRRVD